MLRKILICSILFFGTVSIVSAVNLVGKWKTTITGGQQGNMDLTIVIKAVVADTLSGVFQTPGGELPMSNSKVKGDVFSFDIAFGDRKMRYECTAADEKITMKAPGRNGGEERVMIFNRVKE
jgi:hypothetical protein